MTPAHHAPGHDQVRRRDDLALLAQEPYGANHLDAEARALHQQVDALLRRFSGHDIAFCLQNRHNALAADQRSGYRMEIRLLSQSYQQGGYDALD